MHILVVLLSALGLVGSGIAQSSSSASPATPTAAASASASSFQAYAISVLQTALPSSVIQLALTNPTAVSRQIESEFAAGETPLWFENLPYRVATYLLGPTLPTAPASSTPEPTSSVPSSSSSTKTTSSTRASPTPSGNSNSLSTGAQAGIGVGVGVGGLALLAGLLLFLRRRKKSKDRRPSLGEEKRPYTDTKAELPGDSSASLKGRKHREVSEMEASRDPAELGGLAKPAELGHGQERQELPGDAFWHEMSNDNKSNRMAI